MVDSSPVHGSSVHGLSGNRQTLCSGRSYAPCPTRRYARNVFIPSVVPLCVRQTLLFALLLAAVALCSAAPMEVSEAEELDSTDLSGGDLDGDDLAGAESHYRPNYYRPRYYRSVIQNIIMVLSFYYSFSSNCA